MRFNWEDYWKLADALNRERGKVAPEEACLRSSISRAYYSAFVLTRNFAVNAREITLNRKKGTHRQVIDYFKNHRDGKRAKIGAKLDRLRDNRNKADYDDQIRGRTLLLSLADLSLVDARKVIESLGSLTRQHP